MRPMAILASALGSLDDTTFPMESWPLGCVSSLEGTFATSITDFESDSSAAIAALVAATDCALRHLSSDSAINLILEPGSRSDVALACSQKHSLDMLRNQPPVCSRGARGQNRRLLQRCQKNMCHLLAKSGKNKDLMLFRRQQRRYELTMACASTSSEGGSKFCALVNVGLGISGWTGWCPPVQMNNTLGPQGCYLGIRELYFSLQRVSGFMPRIENGSKPPLLGS